MNKINAIQNQDGTWHVEIHREYITHEVDLVKGATVENRGVSTMTIPRANIKIDAYQDKDDDETIFTLVL